MFTRRSASIRQFYLVALAGLLGVGCVSETNSETLPASKPSTASADATTGAAQNTVGATVSDSTATSTIISSTVTTTIVTKQASPPPATVPAANPLTTSPTPAAPPAPTSAPAAGQQTTLKGTVMQVYSTGDFVLFDGHVNLQIVMQANTAVLNLRGKEVMRQYIQPANTVEVTGVLVGATLTAQTVVAQTTKDGV